jgi:hypothetical protein
MSKLIAKLIFGLTGKVCAYHKYLRSCDSNLPKNISTTGTLKVNFPPKRDVNRYELCKLRYAVYLNNHV